MLQIEENTDDPKGCVVVVAYATSQKTDRVYAGEFVIRAGGTTGLTADTKFDLMNTHPLPFDSAWFGAAPNTNPAHPRRGRLDLTNMDTKKRLQSAIMDAVQVRDDQGKD